MKKQPWKRAQRIALACKEGQTLCCFFRQSEERGNEVAFFLEPSGSLVSRKSAENAIRHGLVVPSNDGLFGSEFSQTWVAP
jgi:hypothetical protein